MNIEKLEENIAALVKNLDRETFIFDLLLAYGQPKSTIARLKKGDYNLAKNEGEILRKKLFYFKCEMDNDLHLAIDQARNNKTIANQHPRFLVVTDYETLLAVDTKTNDTLDIPIKDLAKHADFFGPWAGFEKQQIKSEAHADIKAAERMGRLYDLILQNNPPKTADDRHALNIFLSRLLFCFFAEDTGIFNEDQFTNSLASHTTDDGNDLQAYFKRLFTVLNTKDNANYPKFLQEFPYVNGGLFANESPVPKFDAKSRDMIIECGSLNWKAINPDIFGSMIQAVVHRDQRSSMGVHYTSVVNIMKVIEPLFLNELKEELENAGTSKAKLGLLLERLYRIRVFDPACGSGNFLIIAFKELCKLEIEIFKRLQTKQGGQKQLRFESNIQLTQFYGIEIDDFAHETAKLSLWLAEHQMNLAFKDVFSDARPTLPLQDGGNIFCGNATRLDWEEVCPNNEKIEVYILGNPPYLGSRYQKTSHKVEIRDVCGKLRGSKKLDYIACWFWKAAIFVKSTTSIFGFVSTNSICQGEQVPLMWPPMFDLGLEICFAHQSFPWSNNARSNAGVTCVVIGIADKTKNTRQKIITSDNQTRVVTNINAYLANGGNTIVEKLSNPISKFPKMESGNKATDGGHLILSDIEKDTLVSNYPSSRIFVRQIFGAKEYLNGHRRWCLWIENDKLEDAKQIPPIAERIAKVREVRLASSDDGAIKLADKPHQFREMKRARKVTLICPTVSSSRREYIPIGYLGVEDVVIAPNQAIYDPPIFMFAIVSSRMHVTWVRTVAGRLKTDFRYSSALCYNTFPFPDISKSQQDKLEESVLRVLDVRESHSERTLAELYDPGKMPSSLREAHLQLDLAVENCYRKKPFGNDEERLAYLFELYEKMIKSERHPEPTNA